MPNKQSFNQNQFLPLLAMLYVISIIVGFLFVSKEINIPFIGVASVGAFVLPLSFPIISIIAEVYGYYTSRQIIWSGLIAQAFFCLACYILLNAPTIQTHSDYASYHSYVSIFGLLPRIFISTSIALVIAMFLNSYLLTKWGSLLHQKYFLLRMIGASIIGEGIFTLLAISMVGIGRFPAFMIVQFFIVSYLAKIITTTLSAYPSAIIAALLKRYEKIEPQNEKIESRFFNFVSNEKRGIH